MNESLPAFGSHFEEQQDISTLSSSSQAKNDFLLDVNSLSSSDETVSHRRSGNLSPRGSKRYGMTDFGDLAAQDTDLLQQFDPLSSQNVSSSLTDEDSSTNAQPSIQRLDSRDKMELHRSSGLILGHMKETELTTRTVDGSRGDVSDGTPEQFNHNENTTLESCGEDEHFKNATVKNGKVFYLQPLFAVIG